MAFKEIMVTGRLPNQCPLVCSMEMSLVAKVVFLVALQDQVQNMMWDMPELDHLQQGLGIQSGLCMTQNSSINSHSDDVFSSDGYCEI